MINDNNILVKIILLGDSGVGKSSIMIKFSDYMFNEYTNSTIGVDFRVCYTKINDKLIKMQIWDTAGQERYRNIIKSYYRDVNICIMVYDVLDSNENNGTINYWYKQIEIFTINSELVIVGNKIDMVKEESFYPLEPVLFAKELVLNIIILVQNGTITSIFIENTNNYVNKYNLLNEIKNEDKNENNKNIKFEY